VRIYSVSGTKLTEVPEEQFPLERYIQFSALKVLLCSIKQATIELLFHQRTERPILNVAFRLATELISNYIIILNTIFLQ
jgi:hypothetical protein